jgi:hypothetical protein
MHATSASSITPAANNSYSASRLYGSLPFLACVISSPCLQGPTILQCRSCGSTEDMQWTQPERITIN